MLLPFMPRQTYGGHDVSDRLKDTAVEILRFPGRAIGRRAALVLRPKAMNDKGERALDIALLRVGAGAF